jgi:hypothetical protein
VQGVWSEEEAQAHINLLELWAVFKGLQELIYELHDKTILVKSDNTTVVSYINRQGGTRSQTLCLHTRVLWIWCIDHNIMLKAVHIPGVMNVLADNLSRGVSLNPTEWSLSKQIFQTLYLQRGFPTVDLFASKLNHQLPVYCSLNKDPAALAWDALSIPWINMAAYAFPPISLISRVLQKIVESNCTLLLIAPFWLRQQWFHSLTQLMVDYPIMLPQSQDLLRMPGSKARFHDIEHLQLTAWTLSSNVSRRKDFLRALPIWHQEGGESQLTKYTLLVSDVITTGVILTRSILIQRL